MDNNMQTKDSVETVGFIFGRWTNTKASYDFVVDDIKKCKETGSNVVVLITEGREGNTAASFIAGLQATGIKHSVVSIPQGTKGTEWRGYVQGFFAACTRVVVVHGGFVGKEGTSVVDGFPALATKVGGNANTTVVDLETGDVLIGDEARAWVVAKYPDTPIVGKPMAF